jgi:hypothetical protein
MPTACVVVRRIGCCPEPFAVTTEEFEANECLLPFDQNLTDGNVRSRCETARPANCGPEDCDYEPPPSRVAVPDGEHGCRFVDECTSDDDCTFASQCCGCCACLQPMPKSRAHAETCIVAPDDADEPEPSPSVCVICPGGSTCEGCRHEHVLSCSPTPGGLHRCQWGPPLPEDACTVEHPCAGPLSSANCIPPGVTPCGGPAPPPDECADDSDCALAGETSICSPTGHCGMRRCEPGCTSDADCTLAEVCSPTHHCEPKPCADRAACGPNFQCGADGLCARRVCASTTPCEGQCVNHLCYDAPGLCQFPLP